MSTPDTLPAGRQLDAHDDPESLGMLAWVYEKVAGFDDARFYRFEPSSWDVDCHPIRLPPSWRLAPDPVHGVVLLGTFGQRMTASEAVGRFGVKEIGQP